MAEQKIIDNFPSNRCFKQPMGLEIISLNLRKNDFLELFKSGMSFRPYCPLCDHENSKFNQLVANDYRGLPCYVGECEECGFVFSYMHLNEENLSSYYKHYSTQVRGINISSLEIRKKLFLSRAESFGIERFNFIKGYSQSRKTVVEIGCNDGANLYPFLKNGFNTIGFDLDEDSLKVGREFGLVLKNEDCFDFLKENKADIIILSHFLEHLIDPLSFLKALYDHVDEDCIIYIEVPGIREPRWINWKIGILPSFQFEHLQYFERDSLETLLLKAGFSCLECNEFVRGVFQKKSSLIEINSFNKLNGLQYLYDIEKKWDTSFIRKLYSFLLKIKQLGS